MQQIRPHDGRPFYSNRDGSFDYPGRTAADVYAIRHYPENLMPFDPWPHENRGEWARALRAQTAGAAAQRRRVGR